MYDIFPIKKVGRSVKSDTVPTNYSILNSDEKSTLNDDNNSKNRNSLAIDSESIEAKPQRKDNVKYSPSDEDGDERETNFVSMRNADTRTYKQKMADAWKNRRQTWKDTKNGVGRIAEGWTSIQIAFINEQAGLENEFRRLKRKDGESLVQAARAAKSQADEMLGGNQYSANGKYLGKGLGKIMEPIKAKGEAYKTAFYRLLAERHNIDRLRNTELELIKELERANPDFKNYARLGDKKKAAVDANPDYKRYKRAKELAANPKPVTNHTVEESKQIVADLEKQYPEFIGYAEEIYQYLRNLNQFRVDTGLYTQEFKDMLEEMYPHYVPTFRDTESKLGTGSLKGKYNVAVKSTIKEAKGSERDIINIDESIERQTQETVKAGRVNEVAAALYEDIESSEDYTNVEIKDRSKLTEEELEEIDFEKLQPKNNEVTLFKDGKRVTMKVSKAIFAGFNAFAPSVELDNPALKTVRKINDTFKRLVTSLNPAFLVRNSVRDLQDAGIYTKYGKAFLKNYAVAISQIKTDGELWRLYRAMGGVSSTIYDFDRGIVGTQNKFGMTKPEGKILSKLLQNIENANLFIEQLPRLAEFISSIEAGNTAKQALLDSADVTVNFARTGKITKRLNSTVMPFLNPAVQGFDKIIRTITGARTKRAIAALVTKAAIVGIAPIVLQNLMYDDDEDYEYLSNNDKENNYIFKIGDTFIKIPRGRLAAVLSGVYNRGSQYIGGDKDAFEGYAENIVTQVTPIGNFSRTIASPFTDVKNNITWYGTAIEGRKFENVEPKNRYDESTSKIAISIGQAINYSPKKIHYLLDQYSGVIGDFILPATTSKAEKDFISGNFTIDPKTKNTLATQFYKIYDETNYAKTNGDDTAIYQLRYLSKVRSVISDMYKQKSEIESSDLSDKEKQAQSKVVQLLINEAYKTALNDFELWTNAVKATAELDESVRYTEATRLMYGAERALREYNSDVYAKAQEMASKGIDYETYYNIYFGLRGIAADKDENGNTISGSKKEKVIAYLDSLGLAESQKNAILESLNYKV